MNNEELISFVSESTGEPKKKVAQTWKAIQTAIIDGISSGDSVAIPGFGTLSQGLRAAREGRNPQTGEKIQIAAKKVIKFSAAKAFKDKVNEG